MMKDRDKDGERSAKACGKTDVPAEDEISALQAMRRIKERVRVLRSRLSAISSGTADEKPGERPILERELKKLKSEWQTREHERKKAAHKRMVLLGHEK
jgi:hypothetical protein